MVHVIDNYYALSNNSGYTAVRDTGKVDKKGKTVYATLGYCGNLKEVLLIVLRDLVHERVSVSTMELKQALDYIEQQTNRIMDAMKGIEV